MASVAYLLVAAIGVAFVIRSIRTYLSLRQFGGHWSAGWSRLWLLQTQGSGEMHKRFTAINRKYGEYSTRDGVHPRYRPAGRYAHSTDWRSPSRRALYEGFDLVTRAATSLFVYNYVDTSLDCLNAVAELGAPTLGLNNIGPGSARCA